MKKLIKSKQEAKDLSIEIWSAIVELKLNDKEDLPLDLWTKIKDLRANCPLCEYFKFDTGQTYHNVNTNVVKPIIGVDCDKCPLSKAGHACEDTFKIICPYCDMNDLNICENCFYEYDYYSQWLYAFNMYITNEAKAIEACNNAAIGILDIIKDWEI